MLNGIGTAGSRFLDTVTTNEALHEGTAKAFEMGGKVMGYAGGRILEDITTDVAFRKAEKLLGKIPRLGQILKSGVVTADGLRKYPELMRDYQNLPQEMATLGKELEEIGKRKKQR